MVFTNFNFSSWNPISIAPTTVPNKNNPDDDVNIDVDTNNINRMLKKPLLDKLKKKNKVSYADVVKIKPTK